MHLGIASLAYRLTKSRARVVRAVYADHVSADVETNHLPGEPVAFAAATAGPYYSFELWQPGGRGLSTQRYALRVGR